MAKRKKKTNEKAYQNRENQRKRASHRCFDRLDRRNRFNPD